MSSDHYALVLITDGLSDFVSDLRLAELVRAGANTNTPQMIADAMVCEAKLCRSSDNMSAMVIFNPTSHC